MKKYEKDMIQNMAKQTGKSISDLVRIALLDLGEDFTQTYNNLYKNGMNDWAIWVYCWKCRKALFVKPNSDHHKKIIEVMTGYLEHSECPDE